MHSKFSWTASLGRWFGVPVKVHVLFLLFVTFLFCLEWQGQISTGTALATAMLVFFIALFHEMSHVMVATHLGGRLEELEITPWGGNSTVLMPTEPRMQLVVHLAGPFFNFALFLFGATILTATREPRLLELINPLAPHSMTGGLEEIRLLKICTWVNFQMLILNLLPVFPFDGQRIIRTSVLSHNPHAPQHRLEAVLLGIGICTGLVVLLAAWLLRNENSGPFQPTWFWLTSGGIILIFSARYGFHDQMEQIRQRTELTEDFSDFDALYDEDEEDYLEDYEEELYSDWLNDHQSVSENIERSVEQEEDRRVDRILEKLHHQGIDGLTEEERSFLNRISLRYRRRRQLRS